MQQLRPAAANAQPGAVISPAHPYTRKACTPPCAVGELNWVKRQIAKHHEAAAAKGVKVGRCAPCLAQLYPPLRTTARLQAGGRTLRRPASHASHPASLRAHKASSRPTAASSPHTPLPSLHSVVCSSHPPPPQKKQVVHCCGYDSVPFDIGALVVVDHIRRELGK